MTKRIIAALAAAVMLFLLAAPVYAENPVVQSSFTPDPAPVVFDGVLYFYCGEDSEEDNGFYNMTDWHCFSTTDMVNWLDHGVIMYPEDFEWAEPGSAWAAQCIERNGKYYLYVTVTTDGGRAIGVAVADSPTGPFKDALGKPLCGPDWAYIDPTVMIDDDGQAYLYFGNPTSFYCKLNEDMISLDGGVMQHDMTVKSFGPMPGGGTSYTEGPWLYKRNGIYYLVYASNGVPEGIAYSTSDSPVGPWEYQGLIMNPGSSTTIHPGIIEYKGHNYFFYHGVLLPNGGWNKRSTAIMEFEYGEDGSIPLIEHSIAGVEQLENFNPFGKHEAETMSNSSGVKSVTSDKRVYIGSISDGDYIKLSGVDFEDGAKSFTANLYSGSKGRMDIHLDSQYGKKIGTIELDGSGKFKDVSCSLSSNSGVHDLYFTFMGTKDSDFRFDYWEFSKEEAPEGAGSSGSATVIIVCCAVGAAVIIIAAVIIAMVAKKKKSAK